MVILSIGLFCAIFVGLIVGLLGGISTEIIETKTKPYQGIWLSVKTSLFVGAAVGLLGTFSFSLIGRWFFGFANGLAMGTTTALLYGRDVAIQHLILTAILWYRGHIPRKYIHFLDHIADLVFLQKVGGGYIFVHRLLLEHFAAMDPDAN